MSKKTHKSTVACCATMLVAACLANDSATKASLQKTLNCGNASEYQLEVVANPNRKLDSDPVVPKDVNIVVAGEVISKIELPKESQAKNFGLVSIKKDKAGFEITVDWGSGVDHYEIQFNFRCKNNNFYLYRVRNVTFSTTNRESGNFLDKKETKVIKVEPNVPVEKFVMLDYL